METARLQRALILLIEDDPGDQELTRRALLEGVVRADMRAVSNGLEAMDYMLRRGGFNERNAPRPDIVLLDLNLPKMDGRQVLAEMNAHPGLRQIPVIVLTTSKQEEDIVRSYDLGCNSFISKPVDIPEFIEVVRQLGRYWFELVTLPGGVGECHAIKH